MSKQDRQGARTTADLEQKYSFGRFFSEQAKENARQNQELDQTNMTMKDFISYASSSIDKLQKDLTAANQTMKELSAKNEALEKKDTSLQNQITKYWETIYPVGHIYLSLSDTSPATLFGGTWERIQDRFLLTAGSTYSAGSTGGTAKHNHDYGMQFGAYYRALSFENNDNAGALVYDENGNITIASKVTTVKSTEPVNDSVTTAYKDVSMNHIRSVGTTSTANNMPPYYTVYAWRRTA